MLKHTLLLLLSAGVLVESAQAQDLRSWLGRWEDSSAPKIVAQYRSQPVAMVPLLRQMNATQSKDKREEIVDSLVRRAAATTAGPNSALHALVGAGRRAVEPEDGPPVPGILDRLIRMFQDTDPNATGGALARARIAGDMLEMPEHTRSLDFLIKVAMTETRGVGQAAMRAMLAEVDPKNNRPRATTPAEIAETKAALRSLWDRFSAEPLLSPLPGSLILEGPPSEVIPDEYARLALENYAQENGWGGGRKRPTRD